MQSYRSAEKAHRQSIKRKIRNQSRLSEIKTYLKKCTTYIEENNLDKVIETFNKSQSLISKAVNKKLIKPNSASRKIRKLHIKVKKLNKEKYKSD